MHSPLSSVSTGAPSPGICVEGGVGVRYRVVDRVDLADAARLYRSGCSLSLVAAHLGVSAGTVLRALRSAGVQMRAVGTSQWITS
jgi:hypothetical protein